MIGQPRSPGRWTGVLLLIGVLLCSSLSHGMPAVAQSENDPSIVLGGSPEAEAPPSGQVDTGDVASDTEPAEPPVEPVTSLVLPSTIVVDTTRYDANTNPCTSIDPGWTFVLVQPGSIESSWVDPATGLGGGLAFDPNSSPPSFGWDAFGGGTIDAAP
jgi:hypothetical protein